MDEIKRYQHEIAELKVEVKKLNYQVLDNKSYIR